MKHLYAALIFLASVSSAFAACMSPDEARGKAEAVGGKMFTLTGEMIDRAGEIYNAIPPQSNAPVKFAALADKPDGSGFLLVGPEGKVCAAEHIDADVYAKIRRTVLGIDS